MGNHVVKDFHQVKLATGQITYGLSKPIIPGSETLERPVTVLVRKDHTRNSLIFFEMSTMMPLYVTRNRKHGMADSVTKDNQGQMLFFTTSTATKKLIYRTKSDVLRCDTSNSTYSHLDDLPCAAEIEIDRSGPAVCAFLSVVVWRGTGPKLLCVYKAVKIEGVKYGALVTDMNGNLLGKSFVDKQRLQPVIDIAEGVDILPVLGLITTLLSNFD